MTILWILQIAMFDLLWAQCISTNDSPSILPAVTKDGWQSGSRFGTRKMGKRADLSPDGKLLLTVGDQKITMIETGPEPQRWTLKDDRGHLSSCAFSPDGKSFASGFWTHGSDEGGALVLRATETGKVLWVRETDSGNPDGISHYSNITSIDFSPDGTLIATGSWDESIKVWKAASGELVKTHIGHEHSVWCVRFSPDGSRLVSASADGTLRIWSPTSDAAPRILRSEPKTGFYAAAFSPDGKTIASGGADSKLRLWSVYTGRLKNSVEGYPDGILHLKYSLDGAYLGSTSQGVKTIKLWKLDETKPKTIIDRRNSWDFESGVLFSPSSKTLILGDETDEIRFWDIQQEKFVPTIDSSINNRAR